MLNFTNEEKKRVYFFSSDIEELINYFSKNKDATLIVSFDEYFDYRDQREYFKNIKLIPFKKILLIGSGSFNFNLKPFEVNEHLIELDDRYAEIAYDFKGFPNLEILRYTYIKNSSNYSNLSKLKELSLWSYNKKHISEFLDLDNLEELRFLQSSIQNLDGIQRLGKLKRVFLIANRSLVFGTNADSHENVEELYIDGCRKIDIDAIPYLFPNLKRLTIMQNGEIKELRHILDNLKKLNELNLIGTKILESDNRYWKDYPNIISIDFLNQKNLLLKPDEFNSVK